MVIKRLSSIVANSLTSGMRNDVIQSACRNGPNVPQCVFDIVNGADRSPRQGASFLMSSASNAGRGVAATLGLLAAMELTASAGPAATSPEPAVAHEGEPALLPDAGDVVTAYTTARRWINAFDLPAPNEPTAGVTVRGADGVCVILRHNGRVVGRGADSTADDLMLRRAIGRALGEVLGDPAVANLPPALTDGIGRALTLELEVAGRPLPLLGQTYQEIAHQLAPGLDGVALRRGKARAMLFPAQMRANNTADRVERLLPSLAVELGLALLPLPQLVKLYDLSIYRFATTHLTQASPDQPPFETYRGDTVVLEADVTRQSIAALADGIAAHLITSISPLPEPLGIMGTYRPTADRYDPLIAPPLEQALAALALGRYSQAPDVDQRKARLAAQASRQILSQLAELAPGEDDPLTSSVACAAIVFAALETAGARDDPSCQRLLAAATNRVLTAHTRVKGPVADDHESAIVRPIGPHGRAMLCSALSRLLRAESASIDPSVVRSAINAVWESVPQHQQVSLLPWLGWAESDYALATGQPIANAERLQEIRAVLDASRIRDGLGDQPVPPDLAGGFALATGGRLIASAQSLRPAAYLAGMLRDPHLTPPHEAQLALGRHLKVMRFIMQLAVRESSAWAFRNPPRALGGIRAAPWDSDQPPAAQALGLIGAAETLMSLEALSQAPCNP